MLDFPIVRRCKLLLSLLSIFGTEVEKLSIVTSILGKLGFIAAAWIRIDSFESKLTVLGSVRSTRSSAERKWFSTSDADDFNRREFARKAFHESHGRVPVAR